MCVFALSFRGKIEARSQDQSFNKDICVLDEFLKQYISNDCCVVTTVRTTAKCSMLDGAFKVFNSNTVKIVEGNYKEGKWDGEMCFYHLNGKPSIRRVYEKGKIQGKESCWDVNGRLLRTVEFLNDEKHGAEIYYGGDQSVIIKIEWKHGHPVDAEFYQNSVLQKRLNSEEVLQWLHQKARESVERLEHKRDSP